MAKSNKKVLIVEDEKPMAHALEVKLSGSGFETTLADDGEEALEAIKKDSFDVILMDLVMPHADGFKVLEKLKDDKTPKVVLSNLSQDEDRVRAKELGASEYFIKSNTSITDIVKYIEGMNL